MQSNERNSNLNKLYIMSDHLLSNSRDPANMKWQRKQTATNSQNDRFTIYAQMNVSNSNDGGIGGGLGGKAYGYGNGYEEAETPVSRSKISQMRETLKNFQMLNAGESRSMPIQVNYGHSGASISNSRSTHAKNTTNFSHNVNPSQNLTQQQPNSPYNYNQEPHFTLDIDYNKKLDKMKQRLQQICRKQYEIGSKSDKDRDIPQHYQQQVVQSPQGSLSMHGSRGNSQLSTTRAQVRSYYEYREQQYGRDGGDQGRYRERDTGRERERRTEDNIYGHKNTVPMPTIIHEDQLEMEQEHRIASTVHLHSYSQHTHSHNHSKNNNYNTFEPEKQVGSKSVYSKIGYQDHSNNNSNNNKKLVNRYSRETSYSGTMSHKKSTQEVQNRLQYYYQLFPSLSEELDMRVYKNQPQQPPKSKQNPSDLNLRRIQQLSSSLFLKSSHKATPAPTPPTRSPNTSITYNKNNSKKSEPPSSKNAKHAATTPNQSSQPTKRRESVGVYVRNHTHNQGKANEKDGRERGTAIKGGERTSKSRGKNGNVGVGHSRSKDKIRGGQGGRKISLVTQKNTQQYFINIVPLATQPQPLHQQSSISLPSSYKPHRSSIKQLLITPASNSFHSLLTASSDYTVQAHYHCYEFQTQSCASRQLYRHRSAVLCLMRIDSTLYSTSADCYLKYSRLEAQGMGIDVGVEMAISGEGVYRFPQCPQQLVCASEDSVLVGWTNGIYIFDTQKSHISRQVGLADGSGYRILQNGHNLYMGTPTTLSLLDLRCSNPLISLYSGLQNIQKWMMGPTNQLCYYYSGDKLYGVNLRRGGGVGAPVYGMPVGQRIVDWSWGMQGGEQPGLLLLTEEIIENIYINRILRMTTTNPNITNPIHSYVKIGQNGQEQYIGNIVNSMNIVRVCDGWIYIGDKMGNIRVIGDE